mgnify:CR=1 FL=1
MNIGEIRELFPVVKRWVYFNHIIGSPVNTKVADAINEALEDMKNNGMLHYTEWIKKVEELRENVALLLNASKDNIAIINNYIQGLGIVSNGYDWKEEDTVILSNVEYESLVYNWLNLASKGVIVKFVSSKEDKVSIEDIIKAIDSNTRVVILSHVQFINGYRVSFEELSRYCRDKGILLIAECTHSLGAFEFDVKREGVDVVIASGNKWLMGPEGCGIMYLSDRAMEKLPATTIGWRIADFGEDSSNYPIKFYESARKYEPSGISITGVYGLNAAIKLILEIGIKNIESRLLDLSVYLTNRLSEKKYELYSDTDKNKISGIVSFYSKIIQSKDIRSKLFKHNIAIAEKRNYAIVSLHFYNTEEEIDRMISVLE